MNQRENIRKKKREILDKYFPNMGVDECDFDVDTGKCKKCGTFFADSKMRLCAIISHEELGERDREYDDWMWK